MERAPLPAAILAPLAALATTLLTWAQQHRDAPLADQEAAVLAAVRAALPHLLGAVVHVSVTDLDAGIAAVRRRCPGCDQRVRRQSERPRTVQTTCGPLTVSRPWYACAACGHGFSPVDATLGLPARARLSPALVGWVARLGATTTFREAAAVLALLTGLVVAPDTIREQTTVVGTALEAAQQAAIAQVQVRREAAEPLDPAPGTLVVEADGVMVRYQDGWHEVKVGVVGGTVDGELREASYVAAREPADAFGPRLLAEAARRGALTVQRWEGGVVGRGLAVLRPVHVLGDGAVWIWNLADDHFGDRTEAVDFYHAAEHLWTVARALHGTETAATTAWAQAQIHDLYEDGAAPVLTALRRVRAPTTDAAEVLRAERGYFATNAGRMDYPTLRTQGLPIGSGAVESSARHVVQCRMKRPGQRWSCRGATAVLALRARIASGRPLSSCGTLLH